MGISIWKGIKFRSFPPSHLKNVILIIPPTLSPLRSSVEEKRTCNCCLTKRDTGGRVHRGLEDKKILQGVGTKQILVNISLYIYIPTDVAAPFKVHLFTLKIYLFEKKKLFIIPDVRLRYCVNSSSCVLVRAIRACSSSPVHVHQRSLAWICQNAKWLSILMAGDKKK